MESPPLISVVTPIHSTDHKLPQIREALSLTNKPIQLIVVLNNPILVDQIIPQSSNETVVVSHRKGRGFSFLKGIAEVKGKITLLLHSDTTLPPGWCDAILTKMENPSVVGGGFSMVYDTPNPYLDIVSWFSDQWVRLSEELYGDRAMFIRSHILGRCLSALEVPIFEDLRLSRCMRKFGRLAILKEKVQTSASAYQKHGLLQYILKIWLCRIWHEIGGSPFEIYDFYYSTSKSR